MRKVIYWYLSQGSSGFSFGGQTSSGARGFRVQYNTSDYSYQSSNGGWSDTGSFKSGSNVIDIWTVVPDTAGHTVAGITYFIDSAGADRVCFIDNVPTELVFAQRDMTEDFRVSNCDQPVSVDSINEEIICWTQRIIDATDKILVRNFAGTLLDNQAVTTNLLAGTGGYDPATGNYYLAGENDVGMGGIQKAQVWRRVGGTWQKIETLWWKSIDGICYDPIFNIVLNYPNTGTAIYLREQAHDGLSRIRIWNNPINWTTEGLVVDLRDGTFWLADPSFFHGGIVNGNRVWHVDPRGLYLKYLNFPHMVSLDKFKHNGTKTGVLNYEVIENASSVVWPIVDFTGFTNQQNASAWQDMDGNALQGLEFRGSNTAPTTSPETPIACSVDIYDANGANDGWGATVPGAWQSTPPSLNFIQARKISADVPAADTITLAELISGQNTKCVLCFPMYSDQLMYMMGAVDANRIYTAINQANPLNNFINTTTTFTPVWVAGSPGYLRDSSTNNNLYLESIAGISSDQAGQLTVVMRRDVITSRAMIFALFTNGSDNNQIRFLWYSSIDTRANEICIEYVDGAGTVTKRVGIVSTLMVFTRIDFISTGSAWKILINGVEQSLTVSAGSNDGTWFGGVTTPNKGGTGLLTGATSLQGLHQMRLFNYANAELNSVENDLIDDFITQESLLA